MSMPQTTRRFLGSLLMGVGALMTLLCGGCSALALVVVAPATLTMVRGFATGRSGESEMYAQLFVAAFLVIGLLPTAIGWGLYQLGRRLYGPWTPPSSNPPWPPTSADAP